MKNRLARVRELLQRELGDILARDHSFPGVLVTVNDVDITPDLKNAHIFIGVLGPAHEQEKVIEQLTKARGMLQQRVCKRVILRHTPHFHFKLDHSVERGVKISRIMEEIDEQLKQSAILNPDPEEPAVAPAEPAPIAASAPAAPTPARGVEDEDEKDDEDEGDDSRPVRGARPRR